MDIYFPLLSSLILIIMVAETSHAISEPYVYWRTLLPHTPMPSVIEQLLHPDVYATEKQATSVYVGKGGVSVNTGKSKPGGTTVDVGKGGVNVHTGKGTSVNIGHGNVAVHANPTGKHGGASVNVGKGGISVTTKPKDKPVLVHIGNLIFHYAASDVNSQDDPAASLFFLRQNLRSGNHFTLQLAESSISKAGFIPRSSADAIPFSTAALPSILNLYPAYSSKAAAMAATLSACEAKPALSETKRCATSLESMVDFATETLGTRKLIAVATEGGNRRYKVESVKMLAAGGDKVVACHQEEFPYAVFFCHSAPRTEIYEVVMDAGDGRAMAVAACHTDTAGWNPKHAAFRVLEVSSGTVPVCHFLPKDNVVWMAKQ